MEFDHLILELTKIPGLESLIPGNEGIYRMAINDKYIIAIAPAPDSSDYYLFSTICIVPSDDKVKSRLFEQFLSCNLFGKETHQGYFAYDERQGSIVLIRQFDTSLPDLGAFMKNLKDFVSTLAYWEEKLESASTLAPRETAPVMGNLTFNLEKKV